MLRPCARRCLQPAEELSLPHLVAYARLALAKFGLQYHPSTPGPADGSPAHDSATGQRSACGHVHPLFGPFQGHACGKIGCH